MSETTYMQNQINKIKQDRLYNLLKIIKNIENQINLSKKLILTYPKDIIIDNILEKLSITSQTDEKYYIDIKNNKLYNDFGIKIDIDKLLNQKTNKLFVKISMKDLLPICSKKELDKLEKNIREMYQEFIKINLDQNSVILNLNVLNNELEKNLKLFKELLNHQEKFYNIFKDLIKYNEITDQLSDTNFTTKLHYHDGGWNFYISGDVTISCEITKSSYIQITIFDSYDDVKYINTYKLILNKTNIYFKPKNLTESISRFKHITDMNYDISDKIADKLEDCVKLHIL